VLVQFFINSFYLLFDIIFYLSSWLILILILFYNGSYRIFSAFSFVLASRLFVFIYWTLLFIEEDNSSSSFVVIYFTELWGWFVLSLWQRHSKPCLCRYIIVVVNSSCSFIMSCADSSTGIRIDFVNFINLKHGHFITSATHFVAVNFVIVFQQ